MKLNYLLLIIALGLPLSSIAQNKSNTGFTVQLKSLSNKVPTLDDIRNGKVTILYFLDNRQIQGELVSCMVIHTNKGNFQPPFVCTSGKNGIPVKDYLSTLRLGSGDKVFIEDFTITFSGKKVKVNSEIELTL